MRRQFALLAVLVLLAGCLIAPVSVSAEEGISMGRTESLYSLAHAGYTLPIYNGSEISHTVDPEIPAGSSAEAEISVPSDGLYEIWFTYMNDFSSTLPAEIVVRIDDAILACAAPLL